MKKIELLDTTLRDGAQGAGISFSPQDKLNIVSALDKLGVHIIEAGNPASSESEQEFFRRLKDLPINASISAFGSTRHKNSSASSDEGLIKLLSVQTEYVSIFGKSNAEDVRSVLGASLEENLRMIYESVDLLVRQGRKVIFDAEHFFDGYNEDKEYALAAITAAHEAGARTICLCDTNGGRLPGEIYDIISQLKSKGFELGMHAHDDIGCGVANTLSAVQAGAVHVQGTLLGMGERCGNANLSAIIPTLMLKLGLDCIPPQKLCLLTKQARTVAEISNVVLPANLPYIGKMAFAHKAGMHIDALSKRPGAFEHIQPEVVGNKRRILLSELSGRSAVIKKLSAIAPELTKDAQITSALTGRLKELEAEGYQFEGADASFELLVQRELGNLSEYFKLEQFKVIEEQVTGKTRTASSAMLKLSVGNQSELTAAEGNGPVDALDEALRKALERFYPAIIDMHLVDYKVRVLDSKSATGARVRVLIESSDGKNYWVTVGVSSDIIEASAIALVESMVYKLYKDEKES